jgi:integrase
MGFVYKQTITRPLPAGATISTKRRRATLKELRKNPNQATVVESIATWRDRSGGRQSGLVVDGGDGSQRVRVESQKYHAKFRDGNGIVQVVPTGCREKQSAMSVLDELTSRAELVKAKVMTSDQANIADFQNTSLSEHIAEYVAHLESRKVHIDRTKTTKTRLVESSNGCGFRYLNDLNADRLHKWLALQLSNKERNMSAAVYNGYIQIWISFGNWCIGKRIGGNRSSMNGDKRLVANPFAGMGKVDEQADRRRKARALNESELIKLLDAAKRRPVDDALTVRTGPKKGELVAKLSNERRSELERTGYERALIYKTAILTGLRFNELQTLVVGDVSFGDLPFIKLQRDNEKNRKGSTVALRSDLAVDLKEWSKGKAKSDLVFCVPTGLLRILNRDLDAAGIPKIDSEGFVVHIHALRHSFGTHLSMAGVAPRTAQAAMRHSNISLTMNTYTDARLLDTSAAVESLPSLPIGKSFVTSMVTSATVDLCHLGVAKQLMSGLGLILVAGL